MRPGTIYEIPCPGEPPFHGRPKTFTAGDAMSVQITLVFLFNFIIALIGTLAYSVRLVGVRTGRIAVSFAIFNVLMLISRTANTFQFPLLTKYVERNPHPDELVNLFYLIIIVAGMATIVGAILIPTFQRILYKGVLSFSVDRSISRLIMHSFSKSGMSYIKECIASPAKENITKLNWRKLPMKIIILNMVTVALLTVGGLAPIFAGSIDPRFRATCITLSSIINGIALIIMSVFVDPQLSVMTDDVVDGKCGEKDFRVCVVGMVVSKTVGTFLAILLLIPASYIIVYFARLI
jgi:hypothetical protein